MMSLSSRSTLVVLCTLIIAFILTIIPLPGFIVLLRPEWVALTLIYWCMALPNRVGVGTAWTTGLFLDVLRGGLLGQQALSLCIIAYIALKLYQRMRVAPLWQQAFSILILITLHQLLNLWVRGISGQPPQSWSYWLPAISSMLIWPLFFLSLRQVRRYYRIS